MPKLLLVAAYSIIEPLGLMFLSAVAHEVGWNTRIIMPKDVEEFLFHVSWYNPDVVGFSIYTGHQQYMMTLIQQAKDLGKKVIVGGPHPTYFPNDYLNVVDYVSVSEGLNNLRRVLTGDCKPGLVFPQKLEKFPLPDRNAYYQYDLVHCNNPIKSVITRTGCPYTCTYCYNSSKVRDIYDNSALEFGDRLFPVNIRSVEAVIAESYNIIEVSSDTKMIFFQDDVFGFDIQWLREFSTSYCGLPYHAQTRFEFIDPKKDKNKERIELLQKSGCTGLTLAIESGDPIIRKAVLNRSMSDDIMFRSFEYLSGNTDFKVRTEQMLGLPCGATADWTEVGLEQDIKTLELNVKLKEQTGLPTMAWASIFTPYVGTPIYNYCIQHGFYLGNNDDTPESFFDGSVINFIKNWCGPKLSKSSDCWMASDELNNHHKKLIMLRNLFMYFAGIKDGHILAREFLNIGHTFENLSTLTRRHLYDHVLYEVT